MLEKLKGLEKWKKSRLAVSLILYLAISIVFLVMTCGYLLNDNHEQAKAWTASKTENSQLNTTIEGIQKKNHTPVVTTGTYVENLKDVNIKENSFDMVMVVWFRWTGHDDLNMINNFRIYKGTINSEETMYDTVNKNDVHYQKVRIDITVNKDYLTPRFPLESHQLKVYLEPNKRCDQVMLKPDLEYSSVNSNLVVSGYKLTKNFISEIPIKYQNTQNDPALDNQKGNLSEVITTEILTSVEIVRDGWGTYIKCFIALFATLVWVLIMLYLSTVHETDPLSMIPGAFFGAVSNILVGANLLPDALEMGLVEFVNIWGIFNILACSIMIISINSIRNRYDSRGFAKIYGRIMFVTTCAVTILGNLVLPLVCVL